MRADALLSAVLFCALLALPGAHSGHRRSLAQDGAVKGDDGSGSQAGVSTMANVTTSDALIEALLSPYITTIRLIGGVVVNAARAREQVLKATGGDGAVNISRDLTITGVAQNTTVAMLDFSLAPRLIRVAPGATLQFYRMHVRGLFERLDSAPALFSNDSTGTARFTNTIVQRTACLPPSQQLIDLINNNKAVSASGGATLVGPSMSSLIGDGKEGTSGEEAGNPTAQSSGFAAPAYQYDQPFCLSTLTDVSADPLAIDDCFDSPLVLQEITIIISGAEKEKDPNEILPGGGDGTTGGGDPGLPGAEGNGGATDGGNEFAVGLKLVFNNTMILCDVFVGPTCAQQRGDALAACIQELVDRRNARMSPMPVPSLPPVRPNTTMGPPPLPSPIPSPPLRTAGGEKGGIRLEAVLVPALVGSVLVAAAVLGGLVYWRRRRRGGPVGAGGKALESQDSDQVLQLQVSDGGGGGGGPPSGAGTAGKGAAGKGSGGGGGSKSSSTKYGKYGKQVTPSTSTAYGSDTGASSGVTGLTYGSSTMTGMSSNTPGASPPDSANTDPTKSITLQHLLGAGSFGRVYYGTWQGQGVAVKIIPHSESANSKVQQEVTLCIRFNHPNVVRSLHCVTFESSERHMSQVESLRSNSTATGSAPPGLNMETWIVLEYCNAGSLASRLNMKAAVMGTGGTGLLLGASFPLSAQDSADAAAGLLGSGASNALGSPAGSMALSTALAQQQQKDAALAHMRGVLSVARDIAAGMAYLHSLNVCHGDLKCENVLLCYKAGMDRASTSGCSNSLRAPLGTAGSSGAQQPPLPPAAAAAGPSSASLLAAGRDRVPFVAKVADFGLSKTFTEATTHMSTGTVGTVTHMCPVLLLTGQMRPSCDVFSFGIMVWQMATGETPFAGMRYAEIVYKVAVAGLRPEFPTHVPKRLATIAEACWAADPTTRPTFEQLVTQLGELLEAADELQAEHDAALLAARGEGVARPEDVALAASASDADAAVASQWAAAAAAALLE